MRSELCETCIKKDVCIKDKNLLGDVFVPGNPLFFDNKKLFEKYKEREKEGFPCQNYVRDGQMIILFSPGDEIEVTIRGKIHSYSIDKDSGDCYTIELNDKSQCRVYMDSEALISGNAHKIQEGSINHETFKPE